MLSVDGMASARFNVSVTAMRQASLAGPRVSQVPRDACGRSEAV